MATQLPKAGVIISELTEVEQQLESAKQSGSDGRNARRSLEAMASKVLEWAPRIAEMGGEGDPNEVANTLLSWAEVVAPNAGTTWDRDTVNAKLQLLDALATLGQLTDVETETVARLKTTLKVSKGGTGERAARTPQTPIEGRPSKVSITVAGEDGATVTISTQTGNVETSASNLKTRATAYFKDATGEPVSAEDQKGLLAAAKEVAEGRSVSETYQGITFVVAE